MDVSEYVQSTTVSPLVAAIERGDIAATQHSLMAGANANEIDQYNNGKRSNNLGINKHIFIVSLFIFLSTPVLTVLCVSV